MAASEITVFKKEEQALEKKVWESGGEKFFLRSNSIPPPHTSSGRNDAAEVRSPGENKTFFISFSIRERGNLQRAPLHPRMAVHSTHSTHETAKRLFLLPRRHHTGKEMEWSVHNCDDDGDRPTDDRAKIPFPE